MLLVVETLDATTVEFLELPGPHFSHSVNCLFWGEDWGKCRGLLVIQSKERDWL